MSGPVTVDHLADSRYVRLTTFRRNGEPVHTAVWHVLVDGVLYVHTGGQTGKAKRLRVNGRAEIAPSDARGRATGEPVEATGAQINGEDVGRIDAAFKDKYGIQHRVVRATSGMRRNKIGEPTYFGFETATAPPHMTGQNLAKQSKQSTERTKQ